MATTSVYLTVLPPLLVCPCRVLGFPKDGLPCSQGDFLMVWECLPSLPSPPLVSVGRNLLAFNDPRGTTSIAAIS